jgi:CrcB protein
MSHEDQPDPHGEHLHGVIDSDIDLHDAQQRAETKPREWDLLIAIAAGGVAGSEARYGLDVAIPHTAHQFPWATLVINVSGCLLIGALMVALVEVLAAHRLLRPFFGVGVLGGYTTFSTFGVDAVQLVRAHRPGIALGYVVASVLLCLVAVWLGSSATRRAFVRTRHPDEASATEPTR